MVEKIKGLTYVPRAKKYCEDRLNVGFMETEHTTMPHHFGRRRRYINYGPVFNTCIGTQRLSLHSPLNSYGINNILYLIWILWMSHLNRDWGSSSFSSVPAGKCRLVPVQKSRSFHPTIPHVAAELTELPLRITQVPDLNQTFPPQFLQPNAEKIFRIRPQPLPSTLFSNHYSKIIVSLEVTFI
jgi:hypothetical protein